MCCAETSRELVLFRESMLQKQLVRQSLPHFGRKDSLQHSPNLGRSGVLLFRTCGKRMGNITAGVGCSVA